MTQRDITTLKGYFNTGDAPTEANFADLIDSTSQIFNVKQYGAVGDNSVDNTSPMNTAAAACLAAKGILYIPEASNYWYRCTGQVNFRGIPRIIMDGAIRTEYAGVGVLFGLDTDRMVRADIQINVGRYPYVHTAGYMAAELRNVISSRIFVRQANGSEIGLKTIGDDNGYVAYNEYILGVLTYNKTSLLVTCTQPGGTLPYGWNNECNYYGGDFEGDVAGAKCCIELQDSGAHHFWKPSFQYINITVNGLICTGASGNHIHEARIEGDADNCIAQFNNSATNWSEDNAFEVGSQSSGKLIYTNEHNCYGNVVYAKRTGRTPLVSILDQTSFRTAYNDGAYFHVPGFALYQHSTDLIFRKIFVGSQLSKKVDNEFLYMDGADFVPGIFVDTSEVKSFYIKNKTHTGTNFSWIATCYDANGNKLTGSSPYYVNGRYDTVWGNQYYGNTFMSTIVFREEVKKAFIGMANTQETYATSAGFDVLVAPSDYVPRVWCGYDGPLEFPGHYLADQAPTKAVFWRGDVVYNDAAATGGTPGWQCVFSLRTALNGGEPVSEVNMVVDSIVGVAANDIIAVALDTGLWHWTTVNGTPSGSTIVLTAGLPSAAADNQPVHVLRWKAMANNT